MNNEKEGKKERKWINKIWKKKTKKQFKPIKPKTENKNENFINEKKKKKCKRNKDTRIKLDI